MTQEPTQKALEYIKDIGSYTREELIELIAELRTKRSIRPEKIRKRVEGAHKAKLEDLPPDFRKKMEEMGLL